MKERRVFIPRFQAFPWLEDLYGIGYEIFP